MIDPLLQNLVEGAEDGIVTGFHMTVLIEGVLIGGVLVSSTVFGARLGALLADIAPDEELERHWLSYGGSLKESLGQVGKRFFHLDDCVYRSGGNLVTTGRAGALWRGRLDDVAAWFPGAEGLSSVSG
jgi:hypothetical protein